MNRHHRRRLRALHKKAFGLSRKIKAEAHTLAPHGDENKLKKAEKKVFKKHEVQAQWIALEIIKYEST